MGIVKFGDVVREVKEKIDRNRNPYEFYVAGDHMDTEDLTIRRRGAFATDDVGPAFIRKFRAGQILYGSRRTYLKKVAVADFDGVTANTTFVLETKDESVLSQRLIPFIMLSDSFTDWSVTNSKGSTNPYVLFSDIAGYEFPLPDMPTQRKLAETLWAMVDAQNAYRNLLSATDELVSAQFVEMFGNPIVNNYQWPVFRLGNISESRLGKMLDAKKQTGQHQRRYLANANVQWFHFDLIKLNQMDFDEQEQKEFALRKGDLLVCEGGEIGRCAIWNEEISDCFFQKAIHRVRCNTNYILPVYLAYNFYCHSRLNHFQDVAGNKVTIAHLPGDKLKALQVMVPPLDLQERFAAFVEQSDKSKLALRQALADLTATSKRIIAENLC